MDYDIDNIIASIDFKANSLVNCGTIMLTNDEIRVLKKYNINYSKCSTLKEILYEIENVDDEQFSLDPELEMISLSIAERDYYQNTNK